MPNLLHVIFLFFECQMVGKYTSQAREIEQRLGRSKKRCFSGFFLPETRRQWVRNRSHCN